MRLELQSVECQCWHEGHHRRFERRVGRSGKTRVHQVELNFSDHDACGDPFFVNGHRVVVVLPLVLGYLGLGAVGEMLLRMRGISPHAG